MRRSRASRQRLVEVVEAMSMQLRTRMLLLADVQQEASVVLAMNVKSSRKKMN
jgi:hypothetical protein